MLHEQYARLGFDPSAAVTRKAVTKAYRKAARTAHPDKGGTADEFSALSEACQALFSVADTAKAEVESWLPYEEKPWLQ